MLVIADTSPFNYLVRLGHADILHDLYGRVLAPRAVLMEMQHSEAPPEVRAWAQSPPDWLEQMQAEHLDLTLPRELGAGEREAISAALELKADLLLIDDWAGRHQAETRNIPVTGTLTVLLKASLQHQLDFPQTLQRLRQLGFRVSPVIQATLLARYHQAKP